MTARKPQRRRQTAAEYAANPCGAYRVVVVGEVIQVWCRACGLAGSFDRAQALLVADTVDGIMGRFEAGGGKRERSRLAGMLRDASIRLYAGEPSTETAP